MNKIYKASKGQFEKDMRSFNENEIQQEEDMIERSMNQGHPSPTPVTPKESNSSPEQPFINYNNTLKLNAFHSLPTNL